jgi:outer membrane protein OmpA-like peptidoglycan-associated protein
MRFATLGFTLALFAGCATARPPQELIDARASYSQAEQGPAKTYKPDRLHEARAELDKAEQAFNDDPNGDRTKTAAYLANRKAQLADVEGHTALAVEQGGEANARTNRTQAAGLQRAKGELTSTREALASQTQALASTSEALNKETEARQRAEAATKDALNKLALASVPVKQDVRGLVITFPGNVLFASGKYALLASAENKLNQVADVLKDQSDHKISVEGYTDSRGSDHMNQELSQNRAESVRKYLVDRGVDGAQIAASGLGSSRPVADNKSAEGRADNRRVEIVVSQTEAK